jgi:NAD(P)-dependent dehydrogenase (short-subunit alcohol dehydrogenase family)
MLTDKVALITGGARGIGAGIARVMAGQGRAWPFSTSMGLPRRALTAVT